MAELGTISERSRSSGAESSDPALAPRVLVVDDNSDAAHALARLITVLGIPVVEAHSGEAALAAIERHRPELIFLDLGMPQLDGVETACAIRARPHADQIVLIALTGQSQEQDRQRTLAAGFAAHLVKPIDLALLERTLDEFLDHSAGRSIDKSRGGGPANRLP